MRASKRRNGEIWAHRPYRTRGQWVIFIVGMVAATFVSAPGLAQQSDDPPAPDDFDSAPDLDEGPRSDYLDPDERGDPDDPVDFADDDAPGNNDTASEDDLGDDDDYDDGYSDDEYDERGEDGVDNDDYEHEDGDDEYDEYEDIPTGTDADFRAGYDDGAATVGMMTALPWVGIGCIATGCGGAIPIIATVIPYVGAIIGPSASLILAVVATVLSAVAGGVWSNTIPSAVTERSERYEDGYRDALSKNAWLYRVFGSLGGSALAFVGVAGLGVVILGSAVVLYGAFFGLALFGGGGFPFAAGASGTSTTSPVYGAAQFGAPHWGAR